MHTIVGKFTLWRFVLFNVYAGELNPPPSTPELERIASSSNFRDCPSFPADTGDIVEQGNSLCMLGI